MPDGIKLENTAIVTVTYELLISKMGDGSKTLHTQKVNKVVAEDPALQEAAEQFFDDKVAWR